MRHLATGWLVVLLAGCGSAPFLQPGDAVRGDLTGEIADTGSLFVTLTLSRQRGENLSPIPFGAAMGKAWPEGQVEFLGSDGKPVAAARRIQFEDGC
jgi:hypothetical protein